MENTPRRDIVVIGASAGGVKALTTLVKCLPDDFDGSIFIVLHLAPFIKSNLPQILSRQKPFSAVHPRDGDEIEQGKIYVAPPDHHLLVEKGHVLVKRGPKENRFRPSIDALFRSAAYEYGPRVIGIILSGLLDDGTSGMWTIKRFGGTTIIQDPADAMHAGMPESVMKFVEIDYQLSVAEIGKLLGKLCAGKLQNASEVPEEETERIRSEIMIAAEKNAFDLRILNAGRPTLLTCPECHGALIEIQEGKFKRYRCHTGHSFSLEALLAGVMKEIEDDLWKAVKGLEESVMLYEQIGQRHADDGEVNAAEELFLKAENSRQRARMLHQNIFINERE